MDVQYYYLYVLVDAWNISASMQQSIMELMNVTTTT